MLAHHYVFVFLLTYLSFGQLAGANNNTEPHWVGSWYVAPTQLSVRFTNTTMRTPVHLTVGGDRLRIRLSNKFGRTPLKVGEARLSTNSGSGKITFDGQTQIVVPPGKMVASDPVNLKTFAGEEVVVSVFYPETIPEEITQHFIEGVTITSGNTVHNASSAKATPVYATYFLMGVDVEHEKSSGTIVAVGDSITDGGSSRWPALLAQRLSKIGKDYGVLNAGISGNRLLSDGGEVAWSALRGSSALNRFQHDALDQPGMKYVILYEGINDLGLGESTKTDEVIAALSKLARRVHDRGAKIFLATLAPFEGTSSPGYYSDEKNEQRNLINAWIRKTIEIDGYFDFDYALADPSRPTRLNPLFDSGDHLHPNDAGERALSEALDLSLFE